MTYVKLQDAVKALEELRHCLRGLDGDWPDALYEAIEALRSLPTDDGWEGIATLRSQLEAAKELLVAEREENLWNAYNTGHEKNGEWTHMCMSDGEWLAQQCGLDPKAQYYSAELVKGLIPNAAKAALGPLPAPPAC